MPEFPLEVSVVDFRLSQIKGWKIPDDSHVGFVTLETDFIKSTKFLILYSYGNNKAKRRKRAYGWNKKVEDYINGISSERPTCRARYQQSPVEIFARFLAVDQVCLMQCEFLFVAITSAILYLLYILVHKVFSFY